MIKVLLLALMVSVAGCASSPVLEESNAKIMVTRDKLSGHGSGTHIGKGYFLTVAHVVKDAKEISLRLEDGRIFKNAEMIWTSKDYDIAIIRVDNFKDLAVHKIDCRNPILGEEISTVGNPRLQEFITSWGRVSNATPRSIGDWKSLIVTDLPAQPGNSGGPVYDKNGKIIGVVAGNLQNDTPFGSISLGFSYFVPSSAICKLIVDFR